MEDKKIENTVTLSLDEYLKLYDTKKEMDTNIKILIDYLFDKGFELNEKNELKFERYNLSESYMAKILKSIDGEKYKNLEIILKEE